MIRDVLEDNFHWCVIWGITFQCLGGLIPRTGARPLLALLGWLTLSVGTLLALVGFAFYAKSKGRSPAWSALAAASIIGWVILILLQPKSTSAIAGEHSQRN